MVKVIILGETNKKNIPVTRLSMLTSLLALMVISIPKMKCLKNLQIVGMGICEYNL